MTTKQKIGMAVLGAVVLAGFLLVASWDGPCGLAVKCISY